TAPGSADSGSTPEDAGVDAYLALDTYGPPRCGDGRILDDELCDDGNDVSGDGCSEDCVLEDGWDCSEGGPTHCAPACGDGYLRGDEVCDDGNGIVGDGCSNCLAFDEGYRCVNEGSYCFSICGDSIVAGHEQCDDGNHEWGDDCDPFCLATSRECGN